MSYNTCFEENTTNRLSPIYYLQKQCTVSPTFLLSHCLTSKRQFLMETSPEILLKIIKLPSPEQLFCTPILIHTKQKHKGQFPVDRFTFTED